jgi:hypothetical protein
MEKAIKTLKIIFWTAIICSFFIFLLYLSDKHERDLPKTKNIDGCEYLINRVHGGEVLTHKGDCKNPIHKKK